MKSLAFLSAHYGRPRSEAALGAGLPWDGRPMSAEVFERAARRMGFRTAQRRRRVQTLPVTVLPVVLILEEGQACVLLEKEPKSSYRIYDPQAGVERRVSADDLHARHTGGVIFIHPDSGFSAQTREGTPPVRPHWFGEILAESAGVYGYVVLTAVLIHLFALASPIFIMSVYDRVIPNDALETGWVLGLGALTVLGFDFLMRTLRGYFIDFAGRRTDVLAGRRVFDQVLDMKLAHRPASSGAFANMLRDFDSVRDFLTSATLTAVVDVPFSLFFLIVIWFLGGSVAFLLAFLVLAVGVVGLLLQIPLKGLVRRSVRAAEARHGVLVEIIQGLETIKAIGADGRMRARYGSLVGETAFWGQKTRFVSGLGMNFATFVQQSASVLVVLLGMYLVRDGTMSMGALIACVILGGRAIAPIGQIANLMTRAHHAGGALQTLDRIMAFPVERPPETLFVHHPDIKGRIAFESVEFSYPKTGVKTLDRVSFHLEAGEKVGLIGRIGSGKSTIARLMLGLYDPQAGAILMDGTDMRQIDPADVRRHMGYIAQDVSLFRGTIRENIALAVPHAPEMAIQEAAIKAGAHGFIQRLPAGYDSPVGERGEGLSGGQRQALALARAILCNPNILVCDEPTNAMDVESEEAFRAHVHTLSRDSTLILITHRQPLLSLVDRLILIDQGRVVADGARDDVLRALSGGKIEVPA